MDKINQELRSGVFDGDLEKVKDALDKGADVNTKDVLTGRNVLMLAADKGKKEMVELLLNESADVNARSEGRWTVLMIAAEGGYGDIVELLIENGAEVDAENTNGKTALMRAIERGHRNVVDLLINRGADVLQVIENELNREHVTSTRMLVEKKGLEGVKNQMQEAIKQEKDPVKKLEMKIKYGKLYRKIVSMMRKETKLEDVKTVKLPRDDIRKFRIRRIVN